MGWFDIDANEQNANPGAITISSDKYGYGGYARRSEVLVMDGDRRALRLSRSFDYEGAEMHVEVSGDGEAQPFGSGSRGGW